MFYSVVMVRIKTEDNSYDHVVKTYNDIDEAYTMYFSYLSSNWTKSSLYSYVAVYIIRSDGVTIEGKNHYIVDNTVVTTD